MRYPLPPRAGDDGNRLSSRVYGGAVVALLLAVTLILAGCGRFNDDEEERDYWSPFNSQSSWTMEDGSMRVELTGFERGHEPGVESEFELILENRRQSSITLDGCLMLIDEESVIQNLNDFEVEMGPDAVARRTLPAPFDEELEPRAYGLAVVVGDLGAIVHTVRLGIADDEAGPWLDAGELGCD